jgi:NADH dehydrogenase
MGVDPDRAGRVRINPDLSLPRHPEVFVVGDLACLVQDGRQVPAVAPAAMQQGRHAARNVVRALRGESPREYRYVDKGSLATIGRSAAVADLGRVRLSGAPAWLAWLVLHLLFLVGFRNRLIVLFQWAWSFLSYDRGARLITGPLQRDPEQARAERRLTRSPASTQTADDAASAGGALAVVGADRVAGSE